MRLWIDKFFTNYHNYKMKIRDFLLRVYIHCYIFHIIFFKAASLIILLYRNLLFFVKNFGIFRYYNL